MKICLLQLNYQIGDLQGNRKKIVTAVQNLKNKDIDLIITSELALIGYPPKDILFNLSFVDRVKQTVTEVAKELKDCPAILLGAVDKNQSGQGKPLYNSAYLLEGGNVKDVFHKKLLPSTDVLDETRYFESSKESQVLTFGDQRIGITICEDIWNDSIIGQTPLYAQNPIELLRKEKVDLILNLSASPFSIKKHDLRKRMFSQIAEKSKTPVIFVNQVGGNDELVFDGRSCGFNEKGEQLGEAAAFTEDQLIIDTEQPAPKTTFPTMIEEKAVWNALVTGTRDYIRKCGFKKVVLGLSGGIDSALTAVIAAYAIGAENVDVVLMPSRYSSQHSIDDSINLAKNLGVQSHLIEINPIVEQLESSLAPLFSGYTVDSTEENIQARVRGNLLMAVSNKHRSLLLTTGNKSELAVGYCTIYGDMSGGLAVISDLPKTMVYRLCRWINQNIDDVIPENIITKAPSAELRPDQKDQDSLPPYDVLDQILYYHIEEHWSAEQIIEKGFDPETVNRIIHLVKISEFKRSQAAPGLKVTDKAFGSGWRMPISSKIS